MLLAAFCLLGSPQDFGAEWLDRVTRDVEQARGPLPKHQPIQKFEVGAMAYYDTNVHLEPDRENANTIFVGFGRARIDYSNPRVDGALDLLASFKQHVPDNEYSDDEERVFGRVRYLDPRYSLEVAEIFRHESDPVDAVFADRSERYVSNTVPRATVEIAGGFALEASANLGVVRYVEKALDELDNINLRADLSAIVRASESLDLIVQAGLLRIDYRYSTGAAPDVDGFYARAGFRADVGPTFSLTALGGWTSAESDDFAGGADGEDLRTGDASVHLRWEARETLVFHADYTRQIGFLGAGEDPFQVVNRWLAAAEIEFTPKVSARARIQYDFLDSARGVERDFLSVGATVSYIPAEKYYVEAGVTWRAGETDFGRSVDYDAAIVHIGFVSTN